jgi:hypothetical protein
MRARLGGYFPFGGIWHKYSTLRRHWARKCIFTVLPILEMSEGSKNPISFGYRILLIH